jgi:uncharacterized membrane protein
VTDDEYLLALCRIDALTDEQLAGIDALGAMSDEELAAFVAACEDAWDSNRQAVTDAKAAIREAIANVRAVEFRTAQAARERDPFRPVRNQEEQDACDIALAGYQAALEAHEAAKKTFKAGVTRGQLEARLT